MLVTLNDARRVIAAAEIKAQEIGQPMNIVVVDEGGNLVAHVRMDEAHSLIQKISSLRGLLCELREYRKEEADP